MDLQVTHWTSSFLRLGPNPDRPPEVCDLAIHGPNRQLEDENARPDWTRSSVRMLGPDVKKIEVQLGQTFRLFCIHHPILWAPSFQVTQFCQLVSWIASANSSSWRRHRPKNWSCSASKCKHIAGCNKATAWGVAQGESVERSVKRSVQTQKSTASWHPNPLQLRMTGCSGQQWSWGALSKATDWWNKFPFHPF